MKRLAIAVAIAVCIPAPALAGSEFSSLHPEEQYSNNAAPLTSAGPYEDLLKQVQEKLNALGFAAGPANGTFNSKTQAALAQFQLASALPASGALDAATLFELGVDLGLTSGPGEAKRDASGASEKAPG